MCASAPRPSSGPAILAPIFPDREELVSNHYTPEQLSKRSGADSIGFLTPENIREIALRFVGRLLFVACFFRAVSFPVPQKADKLALKNF